MKLSEEDKELVGLVAVGLTDDEIATQLQIPKHKVVNHIARLLAKLGAQDRVEIVLYAYSDPPTYQRIGTAVIHRTTEKPTGADSQSEAESQLTLAVVAHVLLLPETDPCSERSAGASVDTRFGNQRS